MQLRQNLKVSHKLEAQALVAHLRRENEEEYARTHQDLQSKHDQTLHNIREDLREEGRRRVALAITYEMNGNSL